MVRNQDRKGSAKGCRGEMTTPTIHQIVLHLVKIITYISVTDSKSFLESYETEEGKKRMLT